MSDQLLTKPIQNFPENPYLDWIKTGLKKYEGRLTEKIVAWQLHIGQHIKFFDQNDKNSWVVVKVTSLPTFNDFGEGFDNLGSELIPNHTREKVIDLYNGLYHYPDEVIRPSQPSEMIKKCGVVAIGFEIVSKNF